MRKLTIRTISFALVAFLVLSLVITANVQPALHTAQEDPIRKITIFYTSDEEGYLEPTKDRIKAYGGTANVMAAMRQRGYRPDNDQSLLLSGGDMWTGPAISTWFQGMSTVQVKNAMGYDAAAIGNHEFDFGQDVLRINKKAARYPFLSANLTVIETGKQVLENLLCCGGAVGRLTYRRSEGHITATLKNGRALDPEATYRVLVNSFMYTGGDKYLFQAQNPKGYNLGVQMQEPVIKWILAQKTSPKRPLESLLDNTERGSLPARFQTGK